MSGFPADPRLPRVYRLTITLGDGVYHATRELGRSYQTGEYLHNYALSYALGLVTADYHDAVQVPHYREHLAPLRERGVYVAPARPQQVRFVSHTFKFADTRNHVQMERSSVNVPGYGRARELAPESQFRAYLLSGEALRFPHWIRLGKWFGKAAVEVQAVSVRRGRGPFTTHHPLNPLDTELRPTLFDLINMPPVSIVDHARFDGPHLTLEDGLNIPADLGYRFP